MQTPHMRRLPLSDSVSALSTLTPPSPILRPTAHLPQTWSISDIPILLYKSDIEPLVLLGGLPHESDAETSELAPSASIGNVATFGPVRRPADGRRLSSRRLWPWPGSFKSLSLSPSREHSRLRSSVSSILGLAIAATPGLAIATTLGSSSSIMSACLNPQHSSSNRLSGSPSSSTQVQAKFYQSISLSEDLSSQFLRPLSSSQTISTLPTPKFSAPSPSPSCNLTELASLPPSRPRWKFKWPLQNQSNAQKSTKISDFEHPSCNEGHRIGSMAAPDSAPCTPIASRPSSPVPTTSSIVTASSFVLVPSTRNSVASSELQSEVDNVPHLPKSLSWLKHDVKHLELFIDQEGFRGAQPSFRLVGFSYFSRSLDADCTTGIVDFMPIRREVFFFHYSPFDSSPVVRRLMVNGEETTDYISRHATLCLKSNGVYSIRGTETSALAATDSKAENSKLKWRFDYAVDDRRNDTGKILPGEKIVTPLTFSCSPWLLHPLQGKKVRLVQIVRKTLMGKLTAEKVEPPQRPVRGVLPDLATSTTNCELPNANARLWGLHRHTKSYAHNNSRLPETKPITLHTKPNDRSLTKVDDGQAPLRRRASSAGEKGTRKRTLRSLLMPLPTVTNGANALLGQNILPNSELSATLSAYRNSDGF